MALENVNFDTSNCTLLEHYIRTKEGAIHSIQITNEEQLLSALTEVCITKAPNPKLLSIFTTKKIAPALFALIK